MSPFLKMASGVLLLWEPLNFAGIALEVWPSLAFRGWTAVVELLAHGMIAALCVAAGMMVLNGAPDGRLVARTAVMLSVGRVIYALFWSALPKQTAPGAEVPLAAIAVAVGAILLVILRGPSTRPSR